MLEPRGGLWSSGSVTDEWNNQRKRGCGSSGGSGGEVRWCVEQLKKILDGSVVVLVD